MQSEVGDTHSLIFSFGLEQIPHPEDGRLHLSLMPLELVRFSDFATSKDQKTEPKVEVLSHEQYVAMLKGRAAKTPSPAPADEASPQPPS